MLLLSAVPRTTPFSLRLPTPVSRFSALRHFSTQSPGDYTGWTVQKTISNALERLHQHQVPEPDSSVHHLLASSLQLSWETGYRQLQRSHDHSALQQQRLTTDQAHDFEQKLSRRLQQEPIQYILGQWDFLDYTISIRPPLLCPRPETEELVMLIMAQSEQSTRTSDPYRILDVGCGTGVIGLALAQQLNTTNVVVDAIDIDPVAIQTSQENALRILGETTHESIYSVSLCSAKDYAPPQRFDMVVSNPPYIPQADMFTLSKDVLNYESENALCGGVDGMDVIRTIVHQLPNWCTPNAVCWMEVDPTHPDLLQEWLESSHDFGVQWESSYKDMFGKDRFVKLRVS